MHDPPRILIVDDNEANRDILEARLKTQGYELLQAADGEEALAAARQHLPDVILLDVMMPKIDGIEVCSRLKSDATLPFMPIILVTAKADSKDVVAGLDAGADEYLTKPIDQAALLARVRSVLRLKALHDEVQAQASELADFNRTLEQRVTDQVAEIERMGRLKRFLAPQIAELVISSGDGRLLESHRRDISVVFCDLRGFTAFAESAEPEEVMTVLREYHATLGTIVRAFEGTLERFTGDGVMVLFNDPLPCPDPPRQALRMAIEMRRCVGDLSAKWRKYGHDLGFGIGIAHGYATLGRIGSDERSEYTAIGTVVNLAARLCAEAASGQILIDSKVQAVVEEIAEAEPAGEFALKGLHRPVRAFNVKGLKD
ncbi:MAG: response regulator [Alphaproteobacteria bacterium]|nr:response regulator [Alphaproteobacteria bacterium]